MLAGQVDSLGSPLENTQQIVNEYCDSMGSAPKRLCTHKCETWAVEALDALPLGDGGCPVVQCHMKALLRCSVGSSSDFLQLSDFWKAMPCDAFWLSDFLQCRATGSEQSHRFALVRWCSINLVDPASSHMLVSKIKPCMSQYKLLYGETANGSLKQL